MTVRQAVTFTVARRTVTAVRIPAMKPFGAIRATGIRGGAAVRLVPVRPVPAVRSFTVAESPFPPCPCPRGGREAYSAQSVRRVMD